MLALYLYHKYDTTPTPADMETYQVFTQTQTHHSYMHIDPNVPRPDAAAMANATSVTSLHFPEPRLDLPSHVRVRPRDSEEESADVGQPAGWAFDSRGEPFPDQPPPYIPWTVLTCSQASTDDFIVRDGFQNVLFWVENKHEHTFHANPIQVFKPHPNDFYKKDLFAVLTFHHRLGVEKDTIELAAKEKVFDLDGVFRREEAKGSRYMSTEYGEWEWRNDSGEPQLYDEHNQLILNYASNKRALNPSLRPQLSLHPKCMRYLDNAILGLVVKLHDLETRKGISRRNDADKAVDIDDS